MIRKVWILLFVLACSKSPAAAESAADVAAEVSAGLDVTPDVAADVSETAADFTTRGLKAVKTVVHIHSAYSHDACDGEVSKTGKINAECVKEFRAGLCAANLDIAFVTDHPSTMNTHTFKELLLFDAAAGDKLLGPEEAPRANVISCPATTENDAHELQILVGFEATHLMPVGLAQHVSPVQLEGGNLSDSVTLTDARARVDAAHAAGALVVNAHSEQDEISAQRLIDVGVDAMEIYNIHANFNTVIGKSGGMSGSLNLGRVFELEAFLGPPQDSPSPSLLLMVMLDLQPEDAFLKWQRVLAHKRVTGLLGNDVHQDVILAPYCGPGGQFEGACDGLADQYPHLVKLLKEGGIPMLADGLRLDSYTRMLRSISDRVLIPAQTTQADLVQATMEALKAGKNWVVFDLMGEPTDFDFFAQDPQKKPVEMGGTAALGTTLQIRTPRACTPARWAPWTLAESQNSADLTQIRTIVWRIAPGVETAENVLEVQGFATMATFKPDKPGQYHLEVRMFPRHLRKYLKALGNHVDTEQRWLVSNPIEVK